jgi:hypothetical protein
LAKAQDKKGLVFAKGGEVRAGVIDHAVFSNERVERPEWAAANAKFLAFKA